MTSTLESEKHPTFLPYGRQHITDADIEAVVNVLKSDRLTQGPSIDEFERKLASSVRSPEAVACASGTAALHLALLALGVGESDVVLTTPNTFLADANCARYVGADVQFADIDATTGLIDPEAVRAVLERDTEHRIKVIIPVHFAGHPADLVKIHAMAHAHGAMIVDDACHAIGASYEFEGEQIQLGGSPHADMTVFSFHPVKHVAMGEGGAITTANPRLAERLRLFRNHGMQKESCRQGEMAISPEGKANPWYYEMSELGYNYRLTDIQAALGASQLDRLEWSLNRREHLAEHYFALIAREFDSNQVRPLTVHDSVTHAYHLFVVQIEFDSWGVSRATVMNRLRDNGIGTQVHYIPVHLQPYYRFHSGTTEGSLPNAEAYYIKALSLPMYPDLTTTDLDRVITRLANALSTNAQPQPTRKLCLK